MVSFKWKKNLTPKKLVFLSGKNLTPKNLVRIRWFCSSPIANFDHMWWNRKNKCSTACSTHSLFYCWFFLKTSQPSRWLLVEDLLLRVIFVRPIACMQFLMSYFRWIMIFAISHRPPVDQIKSRQIRVLRLKVIIEIKYSNE